jgi:hypothetical protein
MDNYRQVMGQEVKRWLLPWPSPNDGNPSELDSKDTGTPLFSPPLSLSLAFSLALVDSFTSFSTGLRMAERGRTSN